MRATDFPTRPEAPRRLPRLDPWRIEGLAVENLIERETGEAAMVNIKPKTTIQMRLSAVGETHSKSLVTARDVTATIDEPLERGGTNLGLSPTETLMSSLIGCTNVISKKIAHKAGFELGEMKVSLTSKFDRRGVLLMEEVDTPFTDIVMDIEVATNGTPEQMDAMKTDLAKFCPVAKVIRAAGVTITENWVIRPL